MYGKRIIVPDCPWCEYSDEQDVVYIPLRASILRLAAPADSDLLADLMLMRARYYFGQHYLTNREYPYMLHLLDLISDLSPKWIDPYLFGAVLLPSEAGTVEEGLYIVNKGLEQFPDNWRLWFYKAYYYWDAYKDNSAAAKYFHQASKCPGAPIYIAELSATLATKAGQRELAIRFLEESLNHFNDPNQRNAIIKKMKEVMEDDGNSNSME